MYFLQCVLLPIGFSFDFENLAECSLAKLVQNIEISQTGLLVHASIFFLKIIYL